MSAGVLVACIGNSLAADDAAGCTVYERLQRHPLPRGTRTEMLGCSEFALLDQLSGERLLVVVDAVKFGHAPGTVHVLPWEQIPSAARRAVSIHGVGIRETIDVARTLRPDAVPKHIVLVGIEGCVFDELGCGLSAEVETGVDKAVEVIREMVLSHESRPN